MLVNETCFWFTRNSQIFPLLKNLLYTNYLNLWHLSSSLCLWRVTESIVWSVKTGLGVSTVILHPTLVFGLIVFTHFFTFALFISFTNIYRERSSTLVSSHTNGPLLFPIPLEIHNNKKIETKIRHSIHNLYTVVLSVYTLLRVVVPH